MSASPPLNENNGRSPTGFRARERSGASLQGLRQFTRKREPARGPRQPQGIAVPPEGVATRVEHCELCHEVIAPEHTHLLALASRTLLCACHPCSVLFNKEGAGDRKYRLVPRRCLALQDFHMTDEQWDNLMIPVNMVYIFHNSAAQHAQAFYPSPAGPMESLLSLEDWGVLVSSNPILHEMEQDVEALLINRIRDAREHYLVPIDACYQLVGLIRLYWKGLSGGEEVWQAIADFFADLRTKSELIRGETDARPEL